MTCWPTAPGGGDRPVALEGVRVGGLDLLERHLGGLGGLVDLHAVDLQAHAVQQRLARIQAGLVGLAERDALLGEQVAGGGRGRGDDALLTVGDEDDVLGRGDRQLHALQRESLAAAGRQDEVVGAEAELAQRLVHRQRGHVDLARDAVHGELEGAGAVEDDGVAVADRSAAAGRRTSCAAGSRPSSSRTSPTVSA